MMRAMWNGKGPPAEIWPRADYSYENGVLWWQELNALIHCEPIWIIVHEKLESVDPVGFYRTTEVPVGWSFV